MIDITIQEQDFDLAAEYQTLCADASGAGAVVAFVGLVRDLYVDAESQDQIQHIHLEHYAGMTEKACREVCERAESRFELDAIRLLHRVGTLKANQQIVLVLVAAKHRQAAFDGAQYVMDFLKTDAPIWKKEVGTRGQQWLGMKQSDQQAAQSWEK